VSPTPWIETPLRRSLAAGAGVLLILIPAMTYWEWMAFPGIAALPPCLGAALVIAAGRGGESLVGRMLAWRPLAFMGRISYSLYLWHWPILVFLNLAGFTAATRPYTSFVKLLGVAAAILLAWLSWRYVETPFRFGSWRPRRRLLFLMAGSAAALLAVAGLTAIDMRGLPSRFPPQAIAFASYLDYDPSKAGHFRYGTCFVYFQEDLASLPGSPCLAEETGRPNYLLVGDSHAAHFWYGLSHVFPEINFLQATAARCKPEVDADMRGDAMCSKLRDYVFSDFLATHKIDTLVLAAAWEPSDLQYVAQTLDWAKRKGSRSRSSAPSSNMTTGCRGCSPSRRATTTRGWSTAIASISGRSTRRCAGSPRARALNTSPSMTCCAGGNPACSSRHRRFPCTTIPRI
jgi:hypothetical protein